jgi:2-haloacid dehalogenase
MLDLKRFSILTFDCYGTLIDWESGILAALRPILRAHGIVRSDDELLEQFGELEAALEAGLYLPYREVLARVVDGFGARWGFQATDEERERFATSVGDWPPFADTVGALEALGRHYQLAILSNVDDALFARSAKRLKANFAHVITAQQVGSYKPNPRNFAVAIERLALPKERILHVAQSLFHDIAPANAAGLTTVWVNRRVNRPGFGATPPASAQPDLEVPDLATLARFADAVFAG